MEPDYEGQRQHELEIRFQQAVDKGEHNGVLLEGTNMLGFVTAEREELKGWFGVIAARSTEVAVKNLLKNILPGMVVAENYTSTLDEVMGADVCDSITRSLIKTFVAPHTDPHHLTSLMLLATLGHCSVNGTSNIFNDPSFDFTPVLQYCVGYLLGNYREVTTENRTDAETIHSPATPQIDHCMLMLMMLFDNHELTQESELQIVLDQYILEGKGGVLAVMLSCKMYFRFGLPERSESSSSILAKALVKMITTTKPGSKHCLLYLVLMSRVQAVCDDVAGSLVSLIAVCDSSDTDLLLLSLLHNVVLSSNVQFDETAVQQMVTLVSKLILCDSIQQKHAASLGLVVIHKLLLREETSVRAIEVICSHSSVYRSRQKKCQGTQFVITTNFDEFGEPIGEPCSEDDQLDNELHHQLSPIIYIIDEIGKKLPSAVDNGDESNSNVASRIINWTKSVLSAALPPSLNLVGILPALPEPKQFQPSAVCESLVQFDSLVEASEMLCSGDESELFLRVISCCWGKRPEWSQLRLTAVDN